MARITRQAYADMFGPTTGDRVRLADTDLIIEVERDLTTYGEEVKFGGGKTIRDGMGQSQLARSQGAVDTVITNALIVDHWGVVKADVGLKDGRIAAIGKAGNPDIQSGVDIITVSSWLGHKDIKTTMRYLTTARGSDVRKKVNAGLMASAFSPQAIPVR